MYPTVSYANKDDYLDSFKESEKEFVKECTLPNANGKKYEVKYYATVEDVFETPVSRIGKFNDYHSGPKSMFLDTLIQKMLMFGYSGFMNWMSLFIVVDQEAWFLLMLIRRLNLIIVNPL